MSDLPPGFELESDGLPEGFQLEESPTPLNAARAPERQPITNLGLAVVDSALSPNVMPSPAVDERPVVTNPFVAGYEALKTYPAQLRKGLAAVQMASGGLDPFEIGAAYEQAAQQGRPIDEVIAGRKLLRDTELLGERGDANREIERLRPRTEPWSPAGITSAIVESAPVTAAGIGAGVVAGPGAGLAIMGGLVGSDKFSERKAAGDSDLAAAGAGLYAAGAEAAGEVIPLGRVLKQIKGLGKPFVQSGAFLEGNPLGRIIKQAGLEGSGEIVTEALNTLYDMGVLGETATAAEIIDRLAYAGVVGSAMGGTIQGGIEAVRPFVGRGGSAAAPPPAAGAGTPPPPAGATPAAAPATNSPAPPATNAPPPPPTAAPPVPPTAAPSVAPLDQGGVDLENFGGEPLPADIVREQFIADQGLTQQADGSFATADGALLDPESTATLQNFLAEADEAAAVLEEQGAPVTPETVRRELQNRQRVRDLEAERATVRTPEAQAVIDEQIAAAQQPAGGAVAELQTVADKAKERGDAQTAKAAQDAIKNLQEPTDGAVADRGSEGGRADLGRGEADAGRAGSAPAGNEAADSAPAATPAVGPDLAVEGAAGEQAGSLTAPESPAVAVTNAAVAAPPAETSSKGAPVPISSAGPRRGVIGDKMAAGEVVTTVTGRQTTPFPKIDTATDRKAGNTIKRVDEWLMQNALAEAEARGDEFNARSFRQDLKNPPPASKDSAELYLFGDEISPVIPSVLKPLVPPANPTPLREPTKIEYTTPKGHTTKITIAPPRPDRSENAKDRDKWTVQSSTKAGSIVVPTQTSTFDTEQEAIEFVERQRAKDMGESPKTAPEHSAYPTEGASKEDLQGIVAEFNEAQERQREAGEKVTHIFDAPAKGDVVRLQDKVRVQVGDSGWLTVEQAKAKVAEWKAHAKAQGENPKSRSANADKVVLSLFDLSGEWSQPWVDAGYQVYRFDIQDDPEIGDVTKFSADSFMDTFSAFEGMDVHAILAACPCTDFAVSGARHFAAKDADGRTISSVKLVQQTLATIEFFKPSVWAIENPVGRIEALTGLPPWRLSFDPNHLGDPYTKKTLLWGRFDANLPIAPVEPTEGSKMHRLYGGKSQATKNARSVTPEGFAYAFFMANNAIDNPLLAVAGKYDRLDRDAIKGALDAGLTPAQIGELVDDLYYMELDDEAANAALREAAKPTPGAPRTDEGSKPQAAEQAAEKPSEKPATDSYLLFTGEDGGYPFVIDRERMMRSRLEAAKPIRQEGLDAETNDMLTAANLQEARSSFDASGKFTARPFQVTVNGGVYLFDALYDAKNFAETRGMRDGRRRSLKASEPEAAAEKPASLADQLASMSDADLEALIDEVAHETAAAETEKPKATRSAKTKPPKGPNADALREAYYTPGNIVKSYSGHDRVVAYEPSPADGRGWQVSVRAVVKQGNEWVDAPNEATRWHSTQPDARELQAGPVRSAEKWPPQLQAPAPKLRKGRATVEKATKPADVDRTAAEIAKSLSVNLSSAGQNALTGLTKLFGTSGKVSSGLTFDEDTYKQAKPYFQALLRDFQAAGKDIRDLIRELLNMLGTGAKPYILRFAQDLRSGNTEASNEQGTVRGEDSPQPDGLAPDADQGAEGERGVRGDGAGEGQAGAGAASGADEPGVSGARGRGSRQQRDRQSAAGSRRGSGAVGEGGAGASGAGVSSDPVTPAATNIPAVNFEIADDLRLGRGGEVEKFDDNIKAIETLKRIEAGNRRATADEQKLLARYVGWGGLANAFPDPVSGEWKDKWKERGPRLRDLLSKAEYTAARRSTRNAHYTSEPIVRGMWRAARRLGFRGGLALESSMGVGNFVGLKPADLPAKFIGIEYDSLTARMGAALYPQATVLHAGFQSVPLPESTFALSIGNPPFGSESLRFQYKPELNRLSIHNQFFVGALDAVRPDGLHIAVVSRFLLDAQDTAARLMLAERGDLVAAIRLPDTAFKENARTEVVTDIIILKRRDPADQETMKFAIEAFRQKPERNPDAERERQALAARVPEWVQTTEIADPLGGEPMRVNNYFKANPKNIIGVMERSGSMQHGADITVRLDDAASLEQRLNEIVDRLPEKISNIGQEVLDTTEERYTLLSDALKIAVSGEEIGHVKLENDGTLSRVLEREGPDGSLLMTKQVLSAESPFSDQLAMDEKGRWYRNEVVLDEKGATVKVTGKDGKPTKRNLYQRRVFEKDSEVPLTLRLGKTGFAKLKALAGMRDLLKAQLVLETEDAATSVMEANRKKLAKAYEAFVSEYGPINRANTLSLAMTMPDGGLIAALEVRYQPARSKAQADRSGLPEQEEEAKSAPILRERVVPKYEPPTSAGTAADALAIVLAERGVVDIERIAQLRSISVDEAIEELQKGDKPLVYQDPETQQWETRDAYLSGQVRRKLEAARNAGLEKNIAALEAIQPEPWGAENVTVKMGATWVPPAVYAQFVESLMDGNARVSFSAATNSFDVSVSDANESKRGDWGTQRAPAEWIIDRMLNSMAPTVYDTDSDGKTHLNQEETQLAQLKAREIGNTFDDWIFSETDRRNMLVDLFNEKYNTRVSRQFDGSHLTLPGKVPDSIISMRRHQKNAIWRGISTKTLLLDHVVGAGKTFTGIARAMERRRMGISRKPAIVVPNHLVEQWASDIYRLYPAAKVLAAGKKDFEAKNRRKLFGKIATGDWDVVVIPHSSFGFIGISPDTELRYLESQMAQAQAAIEEAWEAARENGQAEGRRKPFNVKQAERLAETLQSRMDKLREGMRDKLLTYEQLGIDDLTVDEAHEFKNLFYSSRLTGVRGMGNPTGSRKAADLYNKVRATRDMGGSVTFMTGTPVSNSAVELYTMMRYLAPEALEELGITHFDAWRAQYVDASPAFEPTETGRLKQVTRMGRQWENMRSLMDLYYSFADAVTIEDIKAAFAEDNPGKEFPVPKLKGGDRKLVKIEPTEAQVSVLNEIIAGFDGLDNIQDPRERNATRLRLMDRARKVSLDVRAVNPNSTSTEKGGKLETVANEVKRIYNASTERRGTQLIFLDRSVPKSKGDDAVLKKYDELVERQEKALREGDEVALQVVNEELEKFDSTEIEELRAAQNGGWNAYQQIKDNLVALGIPAGEIRFIQEANTDEQKDALFDAVRGGKVRVLLGSTPRMGAGTNVQDRLVAEHHVDVTWKPSDIEQREGRIIRQGNLFVMPDLNGKPNPLYDPLFEIEIQAYATLRTVDSKMWSLNATKLKTINGLRKYDGSFSMQIDDDESVSMAEMAAEASGNPLLLERVKLESEINDLELQQRSHRRKVMAQEDAIGYAKRVIAEYPKRIEETKAKAAEAEKRVSAVLDRIKELKVEVEGKTYTRLPDAQKAAFDAIQEQQAGDERAKYAVAVNGKRYTNKQDIADALGEALGDAEPFEMTIGDKTYYQRTGAARAIRERVLQAAENIGSEKDVSIDLGSAFGFDLVADVQKFKAGGGFNVGFALTDKGKTVAAAYGPEFKLGDKGALSIQALRPAIGGIFEIYSRNANDSSASMLEVTLESARERLPELEAKPVPTFPKADELAGKIARLKQVIAELSGTAVAPPADELSFSRGAGTGAASPAVVARVESMVKAITAAWANPPKAVVVASMQDPKVPEAVRRADADQKAGGATGEPLGWIIGGTIYVNAGAANTAEKVIRTVNHEALGHFGLRAAFGNRLDEELKKVALLRAKDVKAKMAEYGMADTSRNRLRAAEEVLARMAEENPRLPLVQRVLAAIRSFLRPIFKALGVELNLSDAEIIRDYLMPARDFVRRGAGGQATAGVPAFSMQDSAQMTRRMARFVDEFLAKKVRDTDVMVLGPTPRALQSAGAPNLPLEIDGEVIRKALEGKHAAFGISADMLKGLPAQLEDPALIFRSATQQNSLLVVTQMADRMGNPVAAAIHLSKRSGRLVVNRIESAHSRENAESRMVRDAENGLLAYYNDEALARPTTVPLYLGKVVQAAQGLNAKVARRSDLVKAADDDGAAFSRGPAAPASWQASDKSLLDDFIHTLQDKNVDLRRIMQAMRQNGAQIADGQDTYTVEELNTSRKAAQIKTFVDDEVSPILKQMNVEGVTVEELEEYLHARHAPEANQRIADINPNDPNMQDGGSGMLTQDALDYMNNLPANKARSLGRLARMIDDINAGTRQILVDSGLETQATIDEWEATYDHYVPLQREGFEDQAGRGGGQGVSVRGSSVKSRMGSKRAVVDILANVVMQRERVITRAENNRVAQSLLGLAITNPNPDFWLPVNPDVKGSPARSRKLKRELLAMGLTPQDADGVAREPLQRYYNKQTGLVETRLNPALRSRDNVIAVRVNGKDRFVFFKESDPRAMRMVAALKNLDTRDMGRFMRMMSTVTRYFAAVNTQYNIIFGQVNFLRDVQAALLNLGSTAIAGKGSEVAKEAARLYRATRGGLGTMSKLTGADAALWERFKAAGGTTGFRDVFPTTTARTTAIKREIDPTWWTKTPWGKVLTVNGALKVPEEQARQWVSHAFRWISDYNEALENITRMAAFKIALDSGSTEQQAASIAKNMTTNFNRRGQWSQQMGAFYAFFNAGVQGTARIVQAVTKLENGQIRLTTFGKRVIAGGIGLGVIQALALAAAGATDDDPPEFVRERNLILPDFVFGTGAYFSVPMPLGWHVLPNIGRKITELALRGGERPGEAVFDLMRITLDAFNPLGSGTMSQTLTPTIVDPIAALESNKDWTGSKIAREDFNSLDPTPGFTRGRDNASVVGEAVARMLNAATGGTDFTPGDFSPTPDQVDYLAGQIGGGVAREVIKGIDSIGTLMSGELPPPYRVPLAGRFVGTMKGDTNERSRFYENLLSINVAENEARGRKGRGDDIAGYLKQHPEALLKQSADRIKRDVDKLNKQRRERLAQGASAAEVRPMAEQVLQLQRLLNQQYAQAKESAKSR